ncbi:nucleotide exchange factor GrpE [Candidatus Purcelliella pentastirinorum]|uniref:Protein GrpE n=1 Tax=Candidatus Purcelliella pentastirinorum TaxID=472834 RepID=A0AAX3NBC7_9ENTR|nr:nucleotide exchange factor GrpE [Candidatus Purcelliella pentastirinorum]WDI78755.1 nucleotide exchange factor GrpE [Candidatus Purcelliella pentastirinorum]
MEKENKKLIKNKEEKIEKENKKLIKNEDEQIKKNKKKKLIKKLKKKIKNTKKKIKDIQLRSQAEIENINRRNIQNIEKIHKFSLEKFINELLPVVDNLERTLKANKENNKKLQPIMKGIQLTLKSLFDVMSKFGVKNISEQNVLFNPKIHQAIMMEKSDKIKANKIIKIMQPGYLLNGRLLRPAMVIVSK